MVKSESRRVVAGGWSEGGTRSYRFMGIARDREFWRWLCSYIHVLNANELYTKNVHYTTTNN